MAADEIVEKIPYMLGIFMMLTIILMIYIGGLLEAEQVSEERQAEFERMAALESLLNAGAHVDPGDVSYAFSDRRSLLPAEYVMDEGGDPGYEVKDGHCYIPEVSYLDGEERAFYVQPLADVDRNAQDPRQIDCTRSSTPRPPLAISPAILIRKGHNGNPRLPVRLIVYEVP